MTAQIIEIAGQKMAVITIAEYQRLCDAVDDVQDAGRAAAAYARRQASEEYLPSRMVDRLLAGESALRVWREHRGLTPAALSEKSGILESTISDLEDGKVQCKPTTWRALAEGLAVMVDDILPLN